MKFLVHPSFPAHAVELLKLFDGQREFEEFLYPDDTPPDEWLACVAKHNPRPIVLSMDVLPTRNVAARKALREAGCTYVLFDDKWSDLNYATQFC